MRSSSLALALIFSLALLGCGKPFGKQFEAVDYDSEEEIETVEVKDFKNAVEKPPEVLEKVPEKTEDIVDKNYPIRNDQQEFILNKLGHFIWVHFECKVYFLNATGDKVPGDMTIHFSSDSMSIQWKQNGKNPMDYVSKEKVCEQPVLDNGVKAKATGYITKDGVKNGYFLRYTLDSTDPVNLAMRWSANNEKPGDIICRRTSNEIINKGVIQSCELVHNPTTK